MNNKCKTKTVFKGDYVQADIFDRNANGGIFDENELDETIELTIADSDYHDRVDVYCLSEAEDISQELRTAILAITRYKLERSSMVLVDRVFVEDIYELALGDDAINKEYTHDDVLHALKVALKVDDPYAEALEVEQERAAHGDIDICFPYPKIANSDDSQ